jgi:hypothetical protein
MFFAIGKGRKGRNEEHVVAINSERFQGCDSTFRNIGSGNRVWLEQGRPLDGGPNRVQGPIELDPCKGPYGPNSSQPSDL